ncbi:MAG TPA: serine hydrolase domain-containing protein [Kofleriaceae bacterium]|nr:serine hydrolase domain-containing protein [Kofleriaceae bacterium]
MTALRARLSTLVRVAPPDHVERAADRGDEADPRAVGLDASALDAIWRAAVAAYLTGLYPALALCIRRRGRVVLDRALGHARGNAPLDPPGGPRVAASTRTLFNLFSASKMITAMLVHLCDQRGLVHLDDPIARYLPEFGRHGKHRITVRHVLTHRAGIPHIPRQFADPGLLERPDEVLAILADQKPRWAAGRRLAYHALTGGFLLGAVIERVTGKPLRAVMHDEILAPLGFDAANFGVPEARRSEVAINAFTGPPVVPPVSTLLSRALSVDPVEAVRMSNDPRFVTGVVPAGNLIATANEASRLMQLLLEGGALDGVRVFETRTIERAIAEQSYLELDLTLAAPVRYSMGFMLGSRFASLFGLSTQHAFGHVGFTNVFVYADPSRDLAVALMTSGKPVLAPGVTRTLWLLQTIARRVPRDGRGPLRG